MPAEAGNVLLKVIELEKIASFLLLLIGLAIVHFLFRRLPPMVERFLVSLSTSVDRLSLAVGELSASTSRIGIDTNNNKQMMDKHCENAEGIKKTVDESYDILKDIKVTLDNRPCIKKA